MESNKAQFDTNALADLSSTLTNPLVQGSTSLSMTNAVIRDTRRGSKEKMAIRLSKLYNVGLL